MNISYLYRPGQWISVARTTEYFILFRFFTCYNFDKAIKEGSRENPTGGT